MEIRQFNPCEDAIEFRAQFKTFEEAWDQCPRGDWMLWIAKRLDVDLKVLTRAKAKCALTVRHLMKDQRSINACEVALKFADGLATRDELDAAASAAADAASADAAAADAYAASASAASADAASAAAADAASADAAASAAYAASAYAASAEAASASAASADAAASAAYAASAYAVSADAASADAARIKSKKETADICREVLTESVLEAIKKLNP